jgi:hypothetical protein
MEEHSSPDGPSAIADGSQRTASEEHEQCGSEYGGQNTYRSRKRTKFVSVGCELIVFMWAMNKK